MIISRRRKRPRLIRANLSEKDAHFEVVLILARYLTCSTADAACPVEVESELPHRRQILDLSYEFKNDPVVYCSVFHDQPSHNRVELCFLDFL